MTRTTVFGAIAAVAMLTGGAAFAQGASQAPAGHNMPGMDMTSVMKQCMQMRQQMKPGAAVPANMQAMMRQCDAMDQQMAAPADAAAAPHVRTR